MSIRLITGVPGAGKSLCLVDEACKLRDKEPERPFFSVGVDGLRPDVATPLPDLKDWRELPDGSIVLVDEAWRWFPTHSASQQPPDWVRALAEHRHRGFDFIVATQHPTQISSFLRHLCSEHVHLIRKFGTHTVQRVLWQSVHTDVQSTAALKQAQVSVWRFPKERFALYQSATMHTVKRKIPKRVYFALGGLLLLPVLIWVGWNRLHHISGAPAPSSVAAKSSVGSMGPHEHKPVTPAQWVKARLPRVAGVPWSAPMWDNLKVTTTPDLLCVETQVTPDFRRCNCYTEQATPLPHVPDHVCRQAAEHGVYNPYRPRPDSDRGRGERGRGSVAHATRPAAQPSSSSHSVAVATGEGAASAGGASGWSNWHPGAAPGAAGMPTKSYPVSPSPLKSSWRSGSSSSDRR